MILSNCQMDYICSLKYVYIIIYNTYDPIWICAGIKGVLREWPGLKKLPTRRVVLSLA